MIGTAVAMLVNARSSNCEPNQEVDRDPKRLSERNSLLCGHALITFITCLWRSPRPALWWWCEEQGILTHD